MIFIKNALLIFLKPYIHFESLGFTTLCSKPKPNQNLRFVSLLNQNLVGRTFISIFKEGSFLFYNMSIIAEDFFLKSRR